jgi:hypothetical protein
MTGRARDRARNDGSSRHHTQRQAQAYDELAHDPLLFEVGKPKNKNGPPLNLQ